MKNKTTVSLITIAASALAILSVSTSSAQAAITEPDPTFSGDGFEHYDVPGPGGNVQKGYDVQIDSQGRYVVVGESGDGIYAQLVIWRFLSDSTIDTSFNTVGYVAFGESEAFQYPCELIIDLEGKYVVVGDFNNTYSAVWRFNTNGTLDTTFNTFGFVIDEDNATPYGGYSTGRGIHQLADGKYVVVGSAVESDDSSSLTVWKYNNNGTLDTSFGGTGYVVYPYLGDTISGKGLGIDVDSNADYVVTGIAASVTYFDDMSLWRIDGETGELDTTFGTTGQVVFSGAGFERAESGKNVIIDQNGKYVVAGSMSIRTESPYSDLAIWRYDTDGEIDTTFGSGTGYFHAYDYADGDHAAEANNIILEDSGKYVVVANCAGADDQGASVILRINNNGTLDTSFDGIGYAVHEKETIPGGSVWSEIPYAVRLTSDGKYITTGSSLYSTEGESGYDDVMLWKFTNLYQIDNLTTTLDSEVSDVNIETGTANGVYGTYEINVVKSEIPLADIQTTLLQDRDWAAVTADTSSTEHKAFAHALTEAPGAATSFTLYVPKDANDDRVGICSNATTLVEVSPTCAGIEYRTTADPTVTVVTIDSLAYWKVTGLTGTGGFSYSLDRLGQTGMAIWPSAIIGVGLIIVSFKKKPF